jgi:hypothetical protein
VQLSNVPEARPARRLIFIGSVLFAALFALNVATTVIAFRHADADRWLNLARLVPNLVVPLLLWRGYVLLAALAERAAIYKHAIEHELPHLQKAVERRTSSERRATHERRTTESAAPALAQHLSTPSDPD